ncbi:peptide deformylase [Methylomarinum sp. Ch1-1]|uniref:Peptide deformylase n=1 Tax=Methylomarinum roseum TaxID=3067653 RepID=A0AAU7NSI6_9GAMM|nr:peptide deformylase [Methylomarinum sp. Ch1-1]MDP4520112.1 peptide deformylase [Methylomarinum sp. Ch1-1]
MTNIRDIIQLGNPLLREHARSVNDGRSPSVQQIIADMLATLAESNGVGIAAPQIGESLRIMIIASRPTPRYPEAPEMEPVVMINPIYQVIDQTLNKDWEGCLSIPGIRALVPRYLSVRVNYQNSDGQNDEMVLHDFVARIFQHEYDHLHGLVYLDRVENNRDIIAESEYLKLFNS